MCPKWACIITSFKATERPWRLCVHFYKELRGLTAPTCNLSLNLLRLERKKLVRHSLWDHMLEMTRVPGSHGQMRRTGESCLMFKPIKWPTKHCLLVGKEGTPVQMRTVFKSWFISLFQAWKVNYTLSTRGTQVPLYKSKDTARKYFFKVNTY